MKVCWIERQSISFIWKYEINYDMLQCLSVSNYMVDLKALANAASILSSGYERLRKSQETAVASRRGNADFHFELLRLRQRWRLKKVGSVVIGDLSYKSGWNSMQNYSGCYH